MPKVARWSEIPAAVRTHLVEKDEGSKHQRGGLKPPASWIENQPEVPEGLWYKDFGSFKICGEGRYPKTFLLAGQPAKGESL
jgi:hypothetical protein